MSDQPRKKRDDETLPGRPRRSDPRHTLRRPVRLRCADWDAYQKLYTTNISRGGMLVRSPDAPAVGTEVEIALAMPDGSSLTLKGRVARIVPPRQGETSVGVGVSLEMSATDRIVLDRYLAMALAAESDSAEDAIPIGERETPRPAEPMQLPPEAYRDGLIPTPPPRARARGEVPVVGIDFGTSTSSIGIVRGADLVLFGDEAGRTAIPSVVWFRGPGDYVVGQEAREQMAMDPTRTVHSIKRLLGTTIDDPHAAPFLMSLACPGRSGPNRSIVFEMNGEEHTPVQIAAIILSYLKWLAERELGGPVERAVLAFPLAFGEQQRADVERAARIAGLDVAAMIPEPAAAAMAYGRHEGRDGVVGIYDFGGGTFDFCVMQIRGGRARILGAAGDPWLGGDDLDHAMARTVADEFWRATKIDVRKRAVEWQRVVQACEEAKCYLSLAEEIDVFVPQIANTAEGPLDLSVPMTRTKLEEITADLVDTTLTVCEEALREARQGLDDVDDVLLTGGTTRLPAVRKAVRLLFRRDPHATVHPEQAVVIGTALRAAEVEGLAVHKGTWPGLTLQQVAGHTVGLAMAGGVTEPVIVRSTPLPTAARRIFSTYRDNQEEITLIVVEGESKRTAENRTVGRFDVTELPPRPAGAVEVEVIFQMNESGALSITARDLATGRRTSSRFDLER